MKNFVTFVRRLLSPSKPSFAIVFICFCFCLVIIRVQIYHEVFHFLVCYKIGALNVSFSGISNPTAGIGDGWNCVEYTKPSTFPFSSVKKKNMCLEISLGTYPTVFSRGGMSTIALIAQQYGSTFFRLFVCFDFHCNKISLFSITPWCTVAICNKRRIL